MAHGIFEQPEEIGRGPGQRHREICGYWLCWDCCLDSVSLSPPHGTRRVANFWLRRQTQSAQQRAGRSCYPNRTPLTSIRLLREYVPLRIEAHREAQFSDQFATTRKRSAELQDRMWAEAVAAAAERPSSITASFIASLNQTIDSEATRISAKRNHVPGAVWLLLLCVTGCGLWLVSYEAGTSGRHSILERFVFPVLVAIVITLITDIDTPRGGLISLDERPLLELNETLRGSSTSTPP